MLLEEQHGLDNLPGQDDQLGGSLRAGHDLQLRVGPGKLATETVSGVSQQGGVTLRGWSGGQSGPGSQAGTGGRSQGRSQGWSDKRSDRTGAGEDWPGITGSWESVGPGV